MDTLGGSDVNARSSQDLPSGTVSREATESPVDWDFFCVSSPSKVRLFGTKACGFADRSIVVSASRLVGIDGFGNISLLGERGGVVEESDFDILDTVVASVFRKLRQRISTIGM